MTESCWCVSVDCSSSTVETVEIVNLLQMEAAARVMLPYRRYAWAKHILEAAQENNHSKHFLFGYNIVLFSWQKLRKPLDARLVTDLLLTLYQMH